MSSFEDHNPSSLLAEAISLHEMYATLVQAGFTEAQAMRLVEVSLSAALNGR